LLDQIFRPPCQDWSGGLAISRAAKLFIIEQYLAWVINCQVWFDGEKTKCRIYWISVFTRCCNQIVMYKCDQPLCSIYFLLLYVYGYFIFLRFLWINNSFIMNIPVCQFSLILSYWSIINYFCLISGNRVNFLR